MRRREIYKFLCGFLAGAGVVHANIGFGIATGMFNEPHYLGHTWSATALWVGGAVYLLVSALLGVLGWGAPRHSQAAGQRRSDAGRVAVDDAGRSAPRPR